VKTRLPRALLLLAALITAAWLVVRARQLHVTVADLPSGDASYYIAQALALRALLLGGELGALFERLTWPELHPPLHPLLLALWSLLVGTGQELLRFGGAAAASIALVLGLPLLGRSTAGSRGTAAGLVAGLIVLAGPFQASHLFTCMTEPTTLLVGVGFLVLAARSMERDTPGTWLLAGAALALTGLARFSGPLLLAPPLLAADLLLRWRTPLRQRAARWACWLAPTVLVFCLWWALEPALPRAIAAFLVTAQPKGAGAVGWLWLPWAYAARSIGSAPMAAILLGALIAGLLPWLHRDDVPLERQLGPLHLQLTPLRRPGLLLIQIAALIGALALSAHPFKLTRNLATVAPLITLAALLPWTGLRLRWGSRGLTRPLALLAALALLIPATWRATVPSPPAPSQGLAARLASVTNDYPDHPIQPELSQVLTTLALARDQAATMLVQGWGYPEGLLHAWAADRAHGLELITRWEPTALALAPGGQAATVALITPPFPPGKGGERDRHPEARAALLAASCTRLQPRPTEHGWAVEAWRCEALDLDAALRPLTREQLIERELEQRGRTKPAGAPPPR